MIYDFGDCELDTRLYTLHQAGQLIHVQRRALQVLIYLLEHRDHIVSKDELIKHVWANQLISNAALESTVRLVRRAIGDSGREQRIIQTRQGLGYRFIAPVQARAEASADSEIATSGLLAEEEETEPSMSISAADAPRIADAQRRQLTLLFCDLANATVLSGQMEPEDYRDVVHAYYGACAEVIRQYDGYIAQYQGDGLLVYFGYPQAHEDDARRAVLTGLDLLTKIDALNHRLQQEQSAEITIRIGVHSGLVVLDERGDPSRPAYLALGETPNVAAHLQDLTIPNAVVVSDATYRLTQGFFVFDALGDFQFKGMVKSLGVYRVTQVSEAQSRFDVAVTRGLTPLVGREQEIGMMLERWEQVHEGQGHVMVLSGEAGIGKSRLVQVLKGRLADRIAVFEGRCSPYLQGTAFHPLTDLLQRMLHWRDDQPAAMQQSKIETFVMQYPLPQSESVSLIASLLSFPLPNNQYPPLDLSQKQQRQKLSELLLTLLVEQARQNPIVLIIEDLHWTDPSTLAFLDLLIEQGPMVAIFTVLTCRLSFTSPWGWRAHLTPLVLGRLSRSQVEKMITSVTRGKILPSEVVDQLVVKTDGVPLFVEELTKTVVESDWLYEDAKGYELIGSLPTLEIPATLHDSLMDRLDRLAMGKEVAQLAATIGRQFSYQLLQAVAPWDDAMLQQGLRQIVEAELCYQHGVPPRAHYQFKHALIRDAAYDSLLRSQRRQIHGHIARVLTHHAQAREREPETIARHYEAAQDMERAIIYWESAGRQARQRSASQEAERHFVHAIHLLHTIGEERERAERELRLRVELWGQLLANYGIGAPEVEENCERAQALLEHVRDPWLTFRVRHSMRALYMARGPLHRAKAIGERLLELLSELGDDSLLLQVHRPHGLCLLYMGELHLSQYHLERTIEIYRPDVHSFQRFEYISDPLVLARCNLGWLACFLGDRERAIDETDRAIALAEKLDHQHSLAFALSLAASTRQALGMIEETQQLAERALSLSQAFGYPYWTAWAQILLGWVRGRSGDPHLATEELQDGLRAYQETGSLQMLPYFLVLLAELDLRRGEPEKAILHLEKAKRMIDIVGVRFYEAELLRQMGCAFAALQDESAKTRQTFLSAIEIAESQGNVLFQMAAQKALEEFLGGEQTLEAQRPPP